MSSPSPDKLLARRVAPWVGKLPFQADAPVLFGPHETYLGNGILPSRTGPADAIDFDNLAHEMAHAIDILQTKGAKFLARPQWGLEIKTVIHIAGQDYHEPITMQATQREARVVGIQKHILEMVGHPDALRATQYYAKVLADFMPDWIKGGSDKAERLATRATLIDQAYASITPGQVVDGWRAVCPLLHKLAREHEAAPSMKARRRIKMR